ncbi:MAG TPA: hypothetical protein VGG03_19085 [Thermoanaerobaculia bacterium]|jgi:hypothetical protein
MRSTRSLTVLAVSLLISSAVFAAEPSLRAADSLRCKELPFVPNVFWTTAYGPARADVVTAKANMLPCSGGAYALCYYSGPAPMTCKVDEARNVASCECSGYQSSGTTYKYFVDINGILNTCVYIETVSVCGTDGSKCQSENSAPVCQYINQNPQALMPKADLISTFSTAETKQHGVGCTPCQGLYAGCMTAPCFNRKNDKGESTVVCECPLYRGPYQVGQKGVKCELGEGLVWSAAYNPAGCPGSSGD